MEWPFQTLEPGVYFGMSDETYHAQPCLSASGIKSLLVSPINFWQQSWMNPWREEERERKDSFDSGTAYHTRILYGPKMFYDLYASDFVPEPGTHYLDTPEELRGALALRGIKSYGRTKYDMSMALLAQDQDIKILEVAKSRHAEANKGKTLLSAKEIRQIERAARMIEHHPEYQKWVAGGQPEVGIIWDDVIPTKNGMMKARFKSKMDYVKVGPIVDLKSIANMKNRNIEKSARFAICDYKYDIQARFYLHASNHMVNFLREGRVFNANGIDPAWLAAVAKDYKRELWFLFQQKGVAPAVTGMKFTLDDTEFESAAWQKIVEGRELFGRMFDKYGTEPWVDDTPASYISYNELPSRIHDL